MTTTELDPGTVSVTPAASVTNGPARRQRQLPRSAVVSLIWLGLIIVGAIAADVLPIADPNANITPTTTPPLRHWPEFLGTDQLGRSVLSRLVFGARVSLAVGLASAGLGLVIGVLIGMLAGVRPRIDHVVGLLTDSVLAFPGIILLLALSAAMGPGFKPLIIGLTAFSIPPFVRLSRANTLVIRHREFVEAARLLGANTPRILFREILPSVIRPVLAYAVVVLAALMVAEASVSFLGLGVVAPTSSWGKMISDGQPQLQHHRELVFVPATVLFLTVYSVGVLGRWLRAKTSPGTAKI